MSKTLLACLTANLVVLAALLAICFSLSARVGDLERVSGIQRAYDRRRFEEYMKLDQEVFRVKFKLLTGQWPKEAEE